MNYVLVFKKQFKEKKVSGEIAFALIGLKHVQIQKPASRSTILRAFVFLAKFAEFYYYKKFEARSPFNSMNECSSCGLPIIEGKKIYQCHLIKDNGFTKPMEKHPMNLYQGVVFTAQI